LNYYSTSKGHVFYENVNKGYSFPEIQDVGSASTPPPSKERTKLPEMNHDVYRIIYRLL
jgi:hypothetical protein